MRPAGNKTPSHEGKGRGNSTPVKFHRDQKDGGLYNSESGQPSVLRRTSLFTKSPSPSDV